MLGGLHSRLGYPGGVGSNLTFFKLFPSLRLLPLCDSPWHILERVFVFFLPFFLIWDSGIFGTALFLPLPSGQISLERFCVVISHFLVTQLFFPFHPFRVIPSFPFPATFVTSRDFLCFSPPRPSRIGPPFFIVSFSVGFIPSLRLFYRLSQFVLDDLDIECFSLPSPPYTPLVAGITVFLLFSFDGLMSPGVPPFVSHFPLHWSLYLEFLPPFHLKQLARGRCPGCCGAGCGSFGQLVFLRFSFSSTTLCGLGFYLFRSM